MKPKSNLMKFLKEGSYFRTLFFFYLKLKGEYMRTEYDFTTAQKAELRKIDEQIEQLNRQIFDLYMKRVSILAQASCRYIFDKDEVPSIDGLIRAGIFDKPVIQKQCVVKIIDVDE